MDAQHCACCRLPILWVGTATWCLCEPFRPGMVLSGFPHECTFARRGHRHEFVTRERLDPASTVVDIVVVCACGQARQVPDRLGHVA